MEINQTPIKTAKNYGINSINIDINTIKNANQLKSNEKNVNFDQIMQKYLKTNNKKYLEEILQNFVVQNPNDLDRLNFSSFATPSNTNFLSNELFEEATNYSNFKQTIEIPKSFEDIHKFIFNFDDNYPKLVGQLNLNIKKDVKTKIVFEFLGTIKFEFYQNLNMTINAEENVDADIIIYTELGEDATNLFAVQSNLQKNAKINICFVDISCKNSIFNYKSEMIGENSESNLNSMYIADKNSILDLNYLINVYSPNSKTNMEVLGAISDNATKHFKGTIDFKKGCKKSCGVENEYCMLLSKSTKSKALPMILCTEEDVDGKHSSSVGKVDSKELFYIMSRGLTQSEATRLVVKAKFNKIISKLFDEELKTKILDTIDRKIK